MSRVAAIDCGTNSIRLADRRHRRRPARPTCIARCGSSGSARVSTPREDSRPTRWRGPALALTDYADLLRAHGVADGADGRDLGDPRRRQPRRVLRDDRRGARRRGPGAVAEVITGAEEAELSFRGAVDELDGAAAPFVVVDLGGGSTEVVLGERDVEASYSADIGCVRLTERCLHSDPPTDGRGRRRAGRGAGRARRGAAGGARRGCAHVGGGGRHDHDVVGARPEDADLRPRGNSPVPGRIRRTAAVCDELLAMTRQQRAVLGPMHEGRVDVIGGGAIVVEELAANSAAARVSTNSSSASTTSSTASRCPSRSNVVVAVGLRRSGPG